MRTLKLYIIAFAATALTGCAFDGVGDEPLSAAPAASANTASAPPALPAAAPPAPSAPPAATTAATPAAAPAKPSRQENVQAYGPHIDAAAFLNALVESGCQIDKAEYKEVKRGGAIKIVCSKTVDALNVELDDL